MRDVGALIHSHRSSVRRDVVRFSSLSLALHARQFRLHGVQVVLLLLLFSTTSAISSRRHLVSVPSHGLRFRASRYVGYPEMAITSAPVSSSSFRVVHRFQGHQHHHQPAPKYKSALFFRDLASSNRSEFHPTTHMDIESRLGVSK